MKRRSWALGEPVRVTRDDRVVAGQVWAPSKPEGTVWLALDDRTFVLADTRTGSVFENLTGRTRGESVGRVAA